MTTSGPYIAGGNRRFCELTSMDAELDSDKKIEGFVSIEGEWMPEDEAVGGKELETEFDIAKAEGSATEAT